MANSPKKQLKAVVQDIAETARAVARKHGARRSVTIIKGETISKDKPTKVRIIKD